MPRPKHFDAYSGIPEIVPGVFVEPGDAVYIVDNEGEVVSWNQDEWNEDPDAVTSTVNAVILAAAKGANAVRQNVNQKGNVLKNLILDTDTRLADTDFSLSDDSLNETIAESSEVETVAELNDEIQVLGGKLTLDRLTGNIQLLDEAGRNLNVFEPCSHLWNEWITSFEVTRNEVENWTNNDKT